MPRLNRNGSAVTAIAGGVMAVDGNTPGPFESMPSGQMAWMTDTLLFGQVDFGSGVQLYKYDVPIGATLVLHAVGANWTVAGGNMYASWAENRTNHPTGIPAAAFPLQISDQGDLALLMNYSAGTDIKIYSNTGSLLDTIIGQVIYNGLSATCPVYLRDDVIAYTVMGGGFRLRQYKPTVTNLAFLLRDDGINWMVPIRVGADLWLMERDGTGRLTLRTTLSTEPWDLTGSSDQTFGPDARLVAPGVIRVAWSTTVGEERDKLVVMDVDLVTGTTALATVVGNALVFEAGPTLSKVAVTGTVLTGGEVTPGSVMKARDVVVGPNGSLHKVSAEVGGTTVVFDGTVTVDVPVPIISLRLAIDGRGRRYAVAATNFAPYAIVLDEGGVLFNVPHGGRFFTAIKGLAVGAEIYGSGTNEDGLHTTISVYGTDTGNTVIRRFKALYGSMGILQITGYTSILSSADPSTLRIVGGVQGYTVNTIESGWSVMQTEDLPPRAGLRVSSPEPQVSSQFVAMTTATWNGYTNMPSYIATGANGSFWVGINDPSATNLAPEPEDVAYEVIRGELPGEAGAFEELPAGSIEYTTVGSFGVAGLGEELFPADEYRVPGIPIKTGSGRIIHPTLGRYDYEVTPDEWLNVDVEAIIPPVWSSARTLTSASNVLWPGSIRDVVVEERWKAPGGISMPIEQLQKLIAIWTNPVDPATGYVTWSPSYHSGVLFKVLPVNLSVGGQGIALDDVVHYKDQRGEDGWVTAPVVLTMRLVERI